MPISKNWSKATESDIKSKAPTKSGIYELKAFGELKYIGSSKNLQRRLLEHLSKNPDGYRYKKAGFLSSHKSMEQNALDNYKDKHGKYPDWNDRKV